jgi:hypothetical protein
MSEKNNIDKKAFLLEQCKELSERQDKLYDEFFSQLTTLDSKEALEILKALSNTSKTNLPK